MPLPNATRWNSWLKFAFYVSDYLEYILGFYLEEKQYEKNDSVETINNIFENSNNNGLVEIYLVFLKSYGSEFINHLDFFQKESDPIFPLIEGRIEQLELFLNNGLTNTNYRKPVIDIIQKFNMDPLVFNEVFQTSFEIAKQKFDNHFLYHPS